jgi:hypothetical protein
VNGERAGRDRGTMVGMGVMIVHVTKENGEHVFAALADTFVVHIPEQKREPTALETAERWLSLDHKVFSLIAANRTDRRVSAHCVDTNKGSLGDTFVAEVTPMWIRFYLMPLVRTSTHREDIEQCSREGTAAYLRIKQLIESVSPVDIR